MRIQRFQFMVIMICILISACNSNTNKSHINESHNTWSSYLGGNDRNHYSTLSEITIENVNHLTVAWSYESSVWGQMQMNPIIIDTILYGVTAAKQAIALDARTGKEIWKVGDTLNKSAGRGVTYWSNGNDKRILFVIGAELMAVNALTGKAIDNFGDNGKIDLRKGLPEAARNKFMTSTTPGTIYKDLIVMPTRVAESEGAAPGDIMAYNVLSGAIEWVFHTVPYPSEEGYNTWEDKEVYKNESIGGGNNWAGSAIDKNLGILYVPTGSFAPDFYGADRKGKNLYSNCLLALDVNSGELLWHFQFVHHDIWDRDPPAPPNLITVERNGKKIEAVAQVTKQGYVFVFDRKTGESLFEITEQPVPQSGLIEEAAWVTQPVPKLPKPFARSSSTISPEDVNPHSIDKEILKDSIALMDTRMFAPPSLNPVLLLPGYDGGAEWGGAGADPFNGILYVNSNEMPWVLQMERNKNQVGNVSKGEKSYMTLCASCHQNNREGAESSGFPSLIDLKSTRSAEYVEQIISGGRGMMPGFPQITEKEKQALVAYLMEIENNSNEEPDKEIVENINSSPYKHKGYNKFLDSEGLPSISPPWGTLNAIDLNNGEFLWSVPFGETPALKKKGISNTGTENYGGPLITESGLLLIGATKDGYFRAFNRHTGELLWEYKLPAPAFATPSTYEIDGKQYVVIACGGEKLGTKKGNQILAFALK